MDLSAVRNLRVKELRAELQKRGLNKNGVKETLVKRLLKEIERENENPTHEINIESQADIQSTRSEQKDLRELLQKVLTSVQELSSRLAKLEKKFDDEKLKKERENLQQIVKSIPGPVEITENPPAPRDVIYSPTVPTKNRFVVLTDMTDSAAISHDNSGQSMSTEDQLMQYRERHRKQLERHRQRRQDLKESSSYDVILVGDSMVKNINGERLSRKNVKRVACVSKPGALVKDIASSSPCAMLKPGGEIIIHAGTNNLAESARSVADQMAFLCESVVAEGFLVSISSIIHRRWESLDERRRVDEINRLMESAARQNNWGFINNGHINDSQHLGRDGVHLNRSGLRLLAGNISRHIYGYRLERGQNRAPSAPNAPAMGQRSPLRSYAEVVAGKTDGSFLTQEDLDFHQASNRARLKTTKEEWYEYLKVVRSVMNG